MIAQEMKNEHVSVSLSSYWINYVTCLHFTKDIKSGRDE